MKKLFFLRAAVVLLASFSTAANAQEKAKPRIGIAGIYVENSVFVPNRQEMVGRPVGLPDYLHQDSVLGQAATWLPALRGGGNGRGPITKESYDRFVEECLEVVKANMPYDGFWFYNHGACSVEGVDDPEGLLMEKIRGVIGDDCLTTTTMDLHGNPSLKVALYSDLITTFRKAPHDDSRESNRRGVANLIERLQSGKGRPAYKAWVSVPILVSGEWSSTREEPAKSLYAMVPQVEAMPGVVDAGIWIAYVWGDNPRNCGTVMVYGDDEDNVRTGAKILAQKFWDSRDEFCLEAPGYELDQCLDLALASNKKPFMISDMGDNPGGGGSGEVTWTLERLLKRQEFYQPNSKRILYCSIPTNELVQKARKAGVGKKVKGYVGAMTDNTYAGPVLLEGTVEWVSPLTPTPNNARPNQNSGLAIIKTGSIYVVVGSSSPTPNLRDYLEKSGQTYQDFDIIMVKQGYLVNQWYSIKGDWVMAFTRGGVDQDFSKLPYKNIIRPMYPIDKAVFDAGYEPELNVIMVPSAKKIYGR
ncbi:MAG: M81 family metallopeptidase [Bacteroidales bacterium]|nr:M81 family metallopeptidase [Bacteroidales bacterium]